VGENVRGPGAQVSVALGEVANEEILQELTGEVVKVGWVPNLSSDNLDLSARYVVQPTFSYSFIGLPSSVKNGGYPAYSQGWSTQSDSPASQR
jgi:hypothetical protein